MFGTEYRCSNPKCAKRWGVRLYREYYMVMYFCKACFPVDRTTGKIEMMIPAIPSKGDDFEYGAGLVRMNFASDANYAEYKSRRDFWESLDE